MTYKSVCAFNQHTWSNTSFSAHSLETRANRCGKFTAKRTITIYQRNLTCSTRFPGSNCMERNKTKVAGKWSSVQVFAFARPCLTRFTEPTLTTKYFAGDKARLGWYVEVSACMLFRFLSPTKSACWHCTGFTTVDENVDIDLHFCLLQQGAGASSTARYPVKFDCLHQPVKPEAW